MTKLGAKRIHTVRVRGGNTKYRALRLEAGNFSWGSERVTRKTRVIGVVYNSTNNELVRTNTLVKGAIIQIDATPFRQWYESHYGQPVTKRGKVRLSLLLIPLLYIYIHTAIAASSVYLADVCVCV
jgi:small subunit ribosomal protein S8e